MSVFRRIPPAYKPIAMYRTIIAFCKKKSILIAQGKGCYFNYLKINYLRNALGGTPISSLKTREK